MWSKEPLSTTLQGCAVALTWRTQGAAWLQPAARQVSEAGCMPACLPAWQLEIAAARAADLGRMHHHGSFCHAVGRLQGRTRPGLAGSWASRVGRGRDVAAQHAIGASHAAVVGLASSAIGGGLWEGQAGGRCLPAGQVTGDRHLCSTGASGLHCVTLLCQQPSGAEPEAGLTGHHQSPSAGSRPAAHGWQSRSGPPARGQPAPWAAARCGRGLRLVGQVLPCRPAPG